MHADRHTYNSTVDRHSLATDNRVAAAGMQSLLEALRVQQQYSHMGPGLLRITLQVSACAGNVSYSCHGNLSLVLHSTTLPPRAAVS